MRTNLLIFFFLLTFIKAICILLFYLIVFSFILLIKYINIFFIYFPKCIFLQHLDFMFISTEEANIIAGCLPNCSSLHKLLFLFTPGGNNSSLTLSKFLPKCCSLQKLN